MSIPITEYRNAKVMAEDGSRVDVEINHPEGGWIPYTIDSNDTDMTIDNDALLTLIGADKAAYVAPTAEEVTSEKAMFARMQRDWFLSEMDLIVANPLRWAAMSSEEQTAWTTYRQALLDVPAQSGFPESINWPTKPDV